MGNVFHFIGTIKWGLDYYVPFLFQPKKNKTMKIFIQLLSLLVLFTFTSCTIEDDTNNIINEQENIVLENSFKTATITYNSSLDKISLNELKEELKVQKIIKLTNNEEVWVINNNEGVSYLEDLMMFVDGVIDVEVVEGRSILNEQEKDGDPVKDDTEGDEEKDGDPVKDDTEGDEEKCGDPVK